MKCDATVIIEDQSGEDTLDTTINTTVNTTVDQSMLGILKDRDDEEESEPVIIGD